MSSNNADLIADYLGEANDYLESLNRVLMDLAEGELPWPSARVNELFRYAHSLKGLSACFGFEATNKLTHQLESALSLVRDGKLAPQQGLVRAMFHALDLVTQLTTEIAGSGSEASAIESALGALQAAVVGSPEVVASTEAGPERAAEATVQRSGETETVRVRMERLDKLVNLTGELVITRSRMQLVARQLRPLLRLSDAQCHARDLKHMLEELQAAQQRSGSGSLLQDGLSIALAQCQRLMHEQSEVASTLRCVKDLDDAAYDLDGVVSGIHEAVLQVRMVSLESVMGRLHRAVRDSSELCGKAVDFETKGGECLVDKRVADELVNPLVHILRNAVDHGIETPTARQQAGKPPRGKVTVMGSQRGSSLLIEIRDDGRGIDSAAILKKAVERGIVTPEQAAVMSETDAQRLIFAPGLSTAKQVTEVSGRGMGMDIVESSIKKLRGNMELWSKLGTGTALTLQLPPSLSILASLMVAVRGSTFALPITEVREIIQLSQTTNHPVQGQRMVMVRERPIPLVMLPDTYRFARLQAQGAAECTHAVVFGVPGNEVALGVDLLIGKEDLVIKPLCAELAQVRGLAGMAIRGDGEVTLILDPISFADYALLSRDS